MIEPPQETEEFSQPIARLADVGFFNGDPASGLEKVRARLLDLSKKNRLLNFKHPKGCLRIIDELPDEIFRKLIEGKRLLINPVPRPDPKELSEEDAERVKLLSGSELLKFVAEQIHHFDTHYELPSPNLDGPAEAHHLDDRLQAYQFPEPLEATASSLSRAAKLAIEETGSNMCYLAFGFLEWLEADFPEKKYLAPVMLMPITISKGDIDPDTSTYRYQIQYSEEDLMPNLSLIEMLKRNFGIALPALPELQEGGRFESLEDFWDKCIVAIQTQPTWRFHRYVSASLFQFQKLLMYLDLNPENWPSGKSIIDHPKIRALFEGSEGSGELIAEDYQIDELGAEVAAVHVIEDADSSQMSALVDVHKGKDVVIQGPPGTGKSQTITNIIADALSENKKVLFVSEKLAALQVVKQRLTNAGLGHFCLELHSNKVSKLAVLQSLAARIDLRVPAVPNILDKLHELEEKKASLSSLIKVLENSDTPTSQTVQQLLVEAASLRLFAQKQLFADDFDRFFQWDGDLPPYEKTTFLKSLCVDLETLHAEIGGKISNHPWREIGHTPIETSSRLILRALETSSEYAASLLASSSVLAASCNAPMEEDLNAIFALAESSANFERVDGEFWHELIPVAACEAEILRRFITAVNSLQERRKTIARTFPFIAPEQVAETQNAADAIEQMSKDFPNGSIAALEQIPTVLAEIIDLLQTSGELIAYIEREFSVLATDEQNWAAVMVSLLECCSEAQNLHLDIRTAGLARPDVEFLIQEAEGRQAHIYAFKQELAENCYVESVPPANELSRIKEILADGGFFAFLSSSWRKARKEYRRLCINKQERWDLSEACDRLDRLISLQTQCDGFASSPRYQEALGPSFIGIGTDFSSIKLVARWLSDCKAKLCVRANNSGLGPFWRLQIIPATTLLEVSVSAPRLAADLKRVHQLLEWIKNVAGFDAGIGNQTLESWIASLKLVSNLLSESNASIAALRPRPDVVITEISESYSEALRYLDEKQKLEVDVEVSALLGTRFQGEQTHLDRLSDVLDFVETIGEIQVPEHYREFFLGISSKETFVSITEGLKVLSEQHGKLITQLSELATYCSIPEEAFSPTKASTVRHLLSSLQDFAKHGGLLEGYIRFKNQVHLCREAGLGPIMDILERDAITPESIMPIVRWMLLERFAKALFSKHSILKREGLALNTLRREYARLDRECITLQQRSIAHKLRAAYVPAGFNASRVRDKTEMALINSQIGLQRPSVTVRNLLSRAGKAILALKPCFMMGPLSVAQFLARGNEEFELLVMDEASQMRPEDALGAIARSKQVVVVGDGKQLPPTSFFSRLGVDDGSAPEDNTSLEESESILEAAAAIFHPSRQLKWHYRSQHESLISFSNYRFYGGKLVVFPSPSGVSPDYGVKFQKVPGLYAGSKNEIEAMEVAKAIIIHIKTRPTESLGVVAMNIQQVALIDDCLDKLTKVDTEAQDAWSEFEKTNGVIFVKNLENVQGDERDIIFISITYGPNEHGVVHKGFGPINGATGWRRLNVLFTRARKRVQVFSSMSGSDIDLPATASVGARALKDYLTFAESGRLPTEVETGRPPDSPFETDVAGFLAERGFECVNQLGVAGFFLDLAVKHPEKPGSYLLGIECDGVAYHSSKCARDRDRLRQEVLERMGWKIHRIWSADWFRDPHHEIRQLTEKLETLLNRRQSHHDLKASGDSRDADEIIGTASGEEWFNAAKWAKDNGFLNGYQRSLLMMTGVDAQQKKGVPPKEDAKAAYIELLRLGLPQVR